MKSLLLFALNFSLAMGFIRSGDINMAESYAARNRSLLTEAQRWPAFPLYGMIWQATVEDAHIRDAEGAQARRRRARQAVRGAVGAPR